MKLARFEAKLLCLCTFAVFSIGRLSAQSPASEPNLTQTVTALDGELFTAYNECNVSKLSSLVATDLEFYHDQTGLSVGRARFLEDIQKYICGKVQRELVPGTLEVHPLKGYGAVEIGTHRFHHPGHDDTEALGEAKFVMLWQNNGGHWQLTRVISYDHEALPK
jgi:hypothetical protein